MRSVPGALSGCIAACASLVAVSSHAQYVNVHAVSGYGPVFGRIAEHQRQPF